MTLKALCKSLKLAPIGTSPAMSVSHVTPSD
jgi:hypothetical protein